MSVSGTIRFLLLLIGVCALLALAAFLWLRFEFARVDQSATPSRTPSMELVRSSRRGENCSQQYATNKAWFGALHVHTAASYDATAFGVTNSVDDAYAFARGKPTALALRDDPQDLVAPSITISSPLDFMAVTDHAEALGENQLCYTADSESYDKLVCRLFRGDLRLPVDELLQPMVRLATLAIFGQDRSSRVCGPDGVICLQRAAVVWQKNHESTERWQDHSENCEFTTFHGYEYSLAENASNLHRNIIFKSAAVPLEIMSAKEKASPEALWQWLDDVCIRGSEHCDVLAIPHNSNWSSGRMWFPYSNRAIPLAQQKAMAELRARLEPLVEIYQVKGDSECRNGIGSVLGAPDEFCDFEKLRPTSESIEDCGEQTGSGGMMLKGCASRYSFVRYALTAGLSEYNKLGTNPFKLGIIAATDSHNGTPAPDPERSYFGSHGSDRDIAHRLKSKVEVPGDIATGSPVRYSPGGVAGIYAHENSREALFEAMQRRETFGTSGPRIEPRLFGAWALPPDLCQQPDWLQQAYQVGVPMGSDLPANTGDAAPIFVASALADSRPGAMGLQRIQIVKGWIDDAGQTHQAIFEIAGDPNNGASVERDSCATTGEGFSQLCSTWQDPEFNPAQSAVYYARVLENPSCRWSQYNCNTLPADARPASCTDSELPWSIQERAWTSPVWYQP